jgi:hypothetical protein
MRSMTGLRCLYAAAAAIAFGLSAGYVHAQEEAPLPGTPTPPADVLVLMKTPDEPAPAQSPSLEELIEKIRKQPDGAQKLERARRAGARIPGDRPGDATAELRRERKSGPRVEGPVLGSSSTAQQQPVMKATRAAPNPTVAGLGNLYVTDFAPRQTSTSSVWGPYYAWASSWPMTGDFDLKPFVSASVFVESTGWYLINFMASQGKAGLRKEGPTSGTPAMYPLLTQWDNSASARWDAYAYLVNLAAGYHYFYWVPDPHWYIFVSEVSVTKL